MKIDYERVDRLLRIVEKVSTVAPRFTHISSEAMAELLQVDEAIEKHKEHERQRPPPPGTPSQPTESVPENDPNEVEPPTDPISPVRRL